MLVTHLIAEKMQKDTPVPESNSLWLPNYWNKTNNLGSRSVPESFWLQHVIRNHFLCQSHRTIYCLQSCTNNFFKHLHSPLLSCSQFVDTFFVTVVPTNETEYSRYSIEKGCQLLALQHISVAQRSHFLPCFFGEEIVVESQWRLSFDWSHEVQPQYLYFYSQLQVLCIFYLLWCSVEHHL